MSFRNIKIFHALYLCPGFHPAYFINANNWNTRTMCETLFNVNNEDTRTTLVTSFRCLCNFEQISHIVLVSIVDFEQVNASWVNILIWFYQVDSTGIYTQPAFTCSTSILETLEHSLKFFKANNKDTRTTYWRRLRAILTENVHRFCKNIWFLYACMLCSHECLLSCLHTCMLSSDIKRANRQNIQMLGKWHNVSYRYLRNIGYLEQNRSMVFKIGLSLLRKFLPN